MEKKIIYKLRKVKKHWVTVAVASSVVVLGAGLSSPVLADTDPNQVTTTSQVSSSRTEAVSSSTEAETTSQTVTTEAQTTSSSQASTTESSATLSTQASRTASSQAQTSTTSQTAAVVSATDSLLNIPNVKQIDGKYYYIGEDGQAKKNFAITVDGKTLYFDKETGALTDSSAYQFTEGLSSLVNNYTPHNQILSLESANLETVDNYLTADSWYRPKDILKDGKEWVASTESDLRPLLMTWWPDKQTQVAYLNYMNNQGLGTGVTYNVYTSQENLTLASQLVQQKIEAKISQVKGTQWLREIMLSFVKSQDNWNSATESDTSAGSKDHLQGGALLYENSDLTAYANSDYRLLNRTPTSQTGEQKYFVDNSIGGYEFLLANDIDNSNPAVQAEQLNWLHYLMNFGTIVANDPEANFDGVRVDAVDNVNADLLQIASDYFKSYYGVDKSESNAINHLSILEAWSDNDPYYNQDTKGAQLPIDNKLRLSLLYALARPLSERSGLEPTITNSLNDRSAEGKSSDRMANYIFIRAHDSEVQTVIAKIIKDNINPKTDGLTFTLDELKQAFKIYNEDMRQADKKYTQFNIPTAYALMLSNKDSITRLYYGDMYTDDGQYMATKSPYYDAIDALLRARIKYAAGGQDMKITYVQGDTANMDWPYNGVLTSVRYGTGANEATDAGTAATRTQGMGVITSNNPSLKLNATDQVVLAMGKAHANQDYRPLVTTTANGLSIYATDAETPSSLIRRTDANGNLVFTAADIQGYSNVQVSGFLGVWVPVGASEDQDVRVAASNQANADGQVYNASAALDSQLIYEGFSNFQDFVTDPSQYTNKKIAENINLFKEWGVTSFELPPQYVSSEDGSFLDAIILNGYAFEDRYDLAMSKNNKYGSKEDLINVLKTLHRNGIQAIADWVPDQIYNLPGKEVVTATRVNNYGVYRQGSEIKDTLYVANTKSSGSDYQSQYGGAFLDELKAKYPEIFERVQISNGQKMPTNEKITEWEAKYFNGTNILGRGAYYVLGDGASDQYFTLSDDKSYLPKQLTNQEAKTGFVKDSKGMTFYSTSGYQAKAAFVKDAKGNWYYFDQNGYMVYGKQDIDGETYYFLSNGVQLRNAILENADGSKFYFGNLGEQYKNNYYSFDSAAGTNWRYFFSDGRMAVGLQTINGVTQYFDDNGFQIKGQWVTDKDGKKRYFDDNSGAMATNRFANDSDGNWYYVGNDGIVLTGLQTISGSVYYFGADGKQVKGELVSLPNNGGLVYFDADSGAIVYNRFVQVGESWYYFASNARAVTGSQTINGQKLYFYSDGKQAKGVIVTTASGQKTYYDADSGELAVNRFAADSQNNWYYFNQNGNAVTGSQTINGQKLYFYSDGKQAKGVFITDAQGNVTYYDANSGELRTNRFEADSNGNWYYLGADGKALKGSQTINGQKLFFNDKGVQVKGDVATDERGILRYYDKETGSLVYNRRRVTLPNGRVITIDRNGVARYL